MSEISDLENRISAAMDRIGRGLEAVANAPAAGAEAGEDVDGLNRALEDEKLAGAQLEERVRVLSERVETLESELSAATERAEAAEGAVSEVEAQRDAALSAQTEAETQRDAAETVKGEAEAGLAAAQAAAADVVPAASDADLAENREAMEELILRLRRMRRLSRNIRENNQRLRDAAEKGVTDPDLINASLRSELENLKVLRETDALETDAILTGLRPMLTGQAAAPSEDAKPMGDA